jgi:hypothetical protein
LSVQNLIMRAMNASLEAWADDVLDDAARASEHLTDGELGDRAVLGWASYYIDLNTLADGWLIADPCSDAMRAFIVEDASGCLETGVLDEVVATVARLAAQPIP